MNRPLRLFLWTAVLAATTLAGARRLGPVPALGPLLDPVHGVWGVARTSELPDTALAEIPGMEGEVTVLYDDRRVPHIFAGSVPDAQRALGYVVARDRLFQLELQTRATAGTLTELVGPAALGIDRQSRGLSLAWSAERDLRRLDERSGQLAALEAYADGVNAFIDELNPGDLPLEYHLLGRQPMRWEPVHTLYLLKRMGWTLSFVPTELRKARVAALVGRDAAEALVPVNSPIQEPIQPFRGTRYVGMDVPPPGDATRRRSFRPRPCRRFWDPWKPVAARTDPSWAATTGWSGPRGRSAATPSWRATPIWSSPYRASGTRRTWWYRVSWTWPA